MKITGDNKEVIGVKVFGSEKMSAPAPFEKIESEPNPPTFNDEQYEEIAKSLATPKINKLNMMAKAEICPQIGRARLIGTKGVAAKIREQYGYEINNTTYLFAEEALYLLELGKLEINAGRVSLSVERARSLLLHSKTHQSPESNPLKIKTCSVDDYLVYKHLSELGYRVRRRDNPINPQTPSSPPPTPNDGLTIKSESVEDCRMEGCEVMDADCLDVPMEDLEDPPTSEFSAAHYRGTKRKFQDLQRSGSDGRVHPNNCSVKDMSEDEDADGELEFPSNPANAISPDSDEFMDGDTPMFLPSGVYTVTEADSDNDISDEPVAGPSNFNSGVHIEELGYSVAGGDGNEEFLLHNEPQPSTSAACLSNSEVFVHLADSDSDSESISSFSNIFCKLVPNAAIQVKFPPKALLPENIPPRDQIVEFEMKSREMARSNSDLEYYVDELTLNPSEEGDEASRLKGCKYRSWREWRLGARVEAQGVLNESLLGSNTTFNSNLENRLQKLNLWGQKEMEPKCKRRTDGGWLSFYIPYEIYHPSVKLSKLKNRKGISPNYVVAIVRNDDIVPSFASCESRLNDIPVLIGLVSDESTIMFMNADSSPVQSLF